MVKLMFLVVMLAFAVYAEGVPAAARNPYDIASNFMGFDLKQMSDPTYMASKLQTSGNSVGAMMSTRQQTVMENGEPVKKYVTNYLVKKDGQLYSGTL